MAFNDDLQTMLIYAADDDTINLKLLKTILSQSNFSNVKLFYSGEALLTEIETQIPDLILLDIMMPEIDGFGLFEKIKAEDLLKDIKVFIWSNLTQKKDKERAEKLKINGYLVKSDYTPASLATKLKNILN